MKPTQLSVAQSLEQSLAAFKIPEAPVTSEKIFPDGGAQTQTLLLKLFPKDIRAVENYLTAGRNAGRHKLNMSQAIRAMVRSASFKLNIVDEVIGEDPRRKAHKLRR